MDASLRVKFLILFISKTCLQVSSLQSQNFWQLVANDCPQTPQCIQNTIQQSIAPIGTTFLLSEEEDKSKNIEEFYGEPILEISHHINQTNFFKEILNKKMGHPPNVATVLYSIYFFKNKKLYTKTITSSTLFLSGNINKRKKGIAELPLAEAIKGMYDELCFFNHKNPQAHSHSERAIFEKSKNLKIPQKTVAVVLHINSSKDPCLICKRALSSWTPTWDEKISTYVVLNRKMIFTNIKTKAVQNRKYKRFNKTIKNIRRASKKVKKH